MLPIMPCLARRSPSPAARLMALLCGSALALSLATPALAQSQTPAPQSALDTTNPPPRVVYDKDKIDFAADEVEYDDATDVVLARGNVFLRRGEQTVRASTVRWNRKTGSIVAQGNLRVVDAEGNELLTEQMELTDDLAIGLTHNMLMLMREGGRLAANEGRRDADGRFILSQAAYTGCDVVDATGCPKSPTWKVTARRVIYDPKTKLVYFKGARLALFGASVLPMPPFKVATDGRALPGFLIPDFRLSSSNGAEFSTTYYARLANNRDIAITGYAFTKAEPMAKVHYRALTDLGAYQMTGYVTRSTATTVSGTPTGQQWRGYIDTNGHFQLSPAWSVDFSGRLASDRTFLRRYYINSDDTLRSTISLDRQGDNSYFSLSGWAFQTLRATETQGLVPIALPMIDWRRRLEDPVLGGKIELQTNTLAITRSAGQNTQRAFTSAQWSRRTTTDMGQIITLTALARGDLYHSNNNALTTTASYRGEGGFQGRAVALGALDITWPLVGEALGGTQVLTPHLQVVTAPSLRNMTIPNEDARAIELETGNLFALNRFPGYDRVEDGTRFTYGFDWQLERSRWRVNATLGQSYRLGARATLLPDGTGLSDRMSDIVGRTELRYRDFLKLTHRYRLDHDTFAFRRNEIDAAIGSDASYVELGYARLNRQIATTQEDLADSNELRAAGRVAFARYWSVFGSGVFDLSNQSLLANTTTSKFQPLRTRIGMSFQSDCFQLDFTWRRDYVTIGDAARGSSFELRFSLKNLGFR
jgi:LPS-assembly protein